MKDYIVYESGTELGVIEVKGGWDNTITFDDVDREVRSHLGSWGCNWCGVAADSAKAAIDAAKNAGMGQVATYPGMSKLYRERFGLNPSPRPQ